MKQVDLSIERLIEIRDDKRLGIKPGVTVQGFLEHWCIETFSEAPLVTHIQRLTDAPGSVFQLKSSGGLAFEFRSSANAMLFKLTWA